MSLKDCYTENDVEFLSSQFFIVDTSDIDLEAIADSSSSEIELDTGVVSCIVVTQDKEAGTDPHNSCLTARIKSVYEVDFSNNNPFLFLDCGGLENDYARADSYLFLRKSGKLYRIGICRNDLHCRHIDPIIFTHGGYCNSETAQCEELNHQYPTSTSIGLTTTTYPREATTVYATTHTEITATHTNTESVTETITSTSTSICPTSTLSFKSSSHVPVPSSPVPSSLYSTMIPEDILKEPLQESCSNISFYNANYMYIYSAALTIVGIILGSMLTIIGIVTLKSEIFKVPELVKEINKLDSYKVDKYKVYSIMSKYYGFNHTSYNEACKFASKNFFSRFFSHIIFKLFSKREKFDIDKLISLPYGVKESFEEALDTKYNKHHHSNIRNLAAEAARSFVRRYYKKGDDDTFEQKHNYEPDHEDLDFISSYCNSRIITSEFDELEIEEIKTTYFLILEKIKK